MLRLTDTCLCSSAISINQDKNRPPLNHQTFQSRTTVGTLDAPSPRELEHKSTSGSNTKTEIQSWSYKYLHDFSFSCQECSFSPTYKCSPYTVCAWVCVFSPGTSITSKMCTIIISFSVWIDPVFNWAWLAVTICGPVMEWDWTNPPKIFKRIEKYKVATLTTHLSPVKWMNITSDSTITSSHSERKYNKAESLLSPQSLVIPNRHNSANEAQGSVSRCNYH